jgi:hypothetical protein
MITVDARCVCLYFYSIAVPFSRATKVRGATVALRGQFSADAKGILPNAMTPGNLLFARLCSTAR